MTLNRFFLLFFFFSLLIYFAISPYVIDQKKLKEIPQLEFQGFTSFEIEGENLKLMLSGESAKRYDDRLLVKEFAVYQESNNSVRIISAKEGVHKGKELLLRGSVEYQGQEGLLLQTEEATLNTKRNTISVKAPFYLKQNGTVIEGTSLFFNQNNDKIVAKGVKASLDTK